jgi:HEPN domain-containing protein
MNATVREWVNKAEGDFGSALREARARKLPNYDSACFHAQQCVEKLMKAVLMDRKVVPPRTHNLVELHRLILTVDTSWLWDEQELDWLSRAAVQYRYPGKMATRQHATTATRLCRRLRERLLGLIG